MQFEIDFRPLTIDEGRALIRFARCVIEQCLKFGDCTVDECIDSVKPYEGKFRSLKLPVFVTIEKIMTSEGGVTKRVIRGSMGIPVPRLDMLNGVLLAAKHAAFRDPRRSCLQASEWHNCVIEITILSEPSVVTLEEFYRKFIIGYHAISLRVDRDLIVILPQMQIDVLEKILFSERRKLSKISLREYVYKLFESFNIPQHVERIAIHSTQIFYELFPEGQVIERKPYLNRYIKYIEREETVKREVSEEKSVLKT